MAPKRLEKIELRPGNGMGSEASNPQDVVHGRAADRARFRLTSREKVAEKGSFEIARCRTEIVTAASAQALWRNRPAHRRRRAVGSS
jgi:hypothetical protein